MFLINFDSVNQIEHHTNDFFLLVMLTVDSPHTERFSSKQLLFYQTNNRDDNPAMILVLVSAESFENHH